jgi:hypothetical protein
LGACGAVFVLAAGAWYFLRPADEPPPNPISAAPKPAAPTPAPVAPVAAVVPVLPAVAPAPVAAVEQAAPKPAVTASVSAAQVAAQAAQVAALQEEVAKLSISARMSGATQRAIIGGKVYVPGDQVSDTLTLQEVQADHVVFRDDSGNLYTR